MLARCCRVAVLALCASEVCAKSFLPYQKEVNDAELRAASPDPKVFTDLLEALSVMQDSYFEPWLGTWPSAIDWTAAVLGTYVSGALKSISHGLDTFDAGSDDFRAKENLITSYFSQVLSFYFGQDTFAIQQQAFDDMLWVVLGWLETIELISLHTTLHYSSSDLGPRMTSDISGILQNQTWHGNIWNPAFAHRARVFWGRASKGWDTKLCGGGMTWNPRLEPYKNAITNELFIAASASMYLFFPGDANTSPYDSLREPVPIDPGSVGPFDPHDRQHRDAAQAGYWWLNASGMLNEQGLYIDGFHISGYNDPKNRNTKCDARNEMVYTYNQGVILTGQLGLWRITGDDKPLKDGHKLIQSVINATGYDLKKDRPVDNIADLKPGELPPWRGLGRAGIIEEQCDVNGECSQNSHAFKGIFFHHLTTFCAPLDSANGAAAGAASPENKTLTESQKAHTTACSSYLGWLKHNAKAALLTRDSKGHFGMWWTAGILSISNTDLATHSEEPRPNEHGTDYRTYGVPRDELWVAPESLSDVPAQDRFGVPNQAPMSRRTKHAPVGVDPLARRAVAGDALDPNNRGRGRTVETQGGGLAVLRALWEISNRAGS